MIENSHVQIDNVCKLKKQHQVRIPYVNILLVYLLSMSILCLFIYSDEKNTLSKSMRVAFGEEGGKQVSQLTSPLCAIRHLFSHVEMHLCVRKGQDSTKEINYFLPIEFRGLAGEHFLTILCCCPGVCVSLGEK